MLPKVSFFTLNNNCEEVEQHNLIIKKNLKNNKLLWKLLLMKTFNNTIEDRLSEAEREEDTIKSFK